MIKWHDREISMYPDNSIWVRPPDDIKRPIGFYATLIERPNEIYFLNLAAWIKITGMPLPDMDKIVDIALKKDVLADPENGHYYCQWNIRSGEEIPGNMEQFESALQDVINYAINYGIQHKNREIRITV